MEDLKSTHAFRSILGVVNLDVMEWRIKMWDRYRGNIQSYVVNEPLNILKNKD